MPNYDLYNELKSLNKYLAQDGKTALADALQDALSRGATATETFMHVRHLLKEFLASKNTENHLIYKKAGEIIAYLDRTLSS